MNIFFILSILIFILLLIKFINKKYEYFIFNIIFFLIFIINIIKDNFTIDLIIYNNEFLSNNYWHFEPFFIFIALVSKLLNFKFYFISSVYSLLTFYFLYKAINNFSININLSLLLFFLIPGMYLNTYIEMRQMLAVSIVGYTICVYTNNENKKLRLLLVLFSILVHYSAIIFWILFILIKDIKSKNQTCMLLFISVFTLVVAFFTRIDILLFELIKLFIKNISILSKYKGYIDQLLNNQIEIVRGQYIKNIFFTIVGLFIGIITLISKNEKNHTMKLMTNIYHIGVIILNLTMYMAPISRLFYYFGIFQIFLLPFAISKFKYTNIRFLLKLFIVFIYFFIFIHGIHYIDINGNYVFYNYSSYLFKRN